MDLAIKRIYEPADADDGYRVLVDRLWPRGVSKARAEIHAWAADLAPSTALRRWFGHDADRWVEFKKRYYRELSVQTVSIESLRLLAAAGPVTLLYAAKDVEHNNARALQEYLLAADKQGEPGAS